MNDAADPNMQEPRSPRWTPEADERSFRSIISAVIVVSCLILTALIFVSLSVVEFGKGYWIGITLDHFPTIIGLPCAGGAAMVVVILLRSVEGPIEFEGLGFKFKGASGPVVLWIFCFLAIAGSIKMLWPLTASWH